MIKKKYHGSENIIEQPVFGFSKTYNAYGIGFYCIEEIDMEKEWGWIPTGLVVPTSMKLNRNKNRVS